jgi:glycosyltransferase involved in cell wall biosynthesis
MAFWRRMNDASDDLTTVVIPAYNAAATLDRTLASVRAQTHHALEIIVVDDGSTDATAEIAERHARSDPRLRVLRQANAGVAAARNTAIAVAHGAFIAPIDADDLWHPAKIEMQVEAMRVGGASVGLAYTWTALIDADDRVIEFADRYPDQGDVLRRLCSGNIVGSGSNALMSAMALRAVGGYDSSLERRSARGCEDFKVNLAIAERFDYALVPSYLTGYRQLPSGMSNDLPQMLRSHQLILDELLARRPDLRRPILEGKSNAQLSAIRRALRNGREDEARYFRRQLIRTQPYHALKAFVYRPLRDKFRWQLGPAGPVHAELIGQRFPLADAPAGA